MHTSSSVEKKLMVDLKCKWNFAGGTERYQSKTVSDKQMKLQWMAIDFK